MKTLRPSASWTNAGEILPKVVMVIVVYFLSAVRFVDCQGPAYLYGTGVTLPCSVTGMEAVAYTWQDVGVTPARIIYFILSSDDSTKHAEVDGLTKYDNFGINNNHPSSVDLTIDSLDFNDNGMYSCTLSRGESPPDELVIVEALPTSVSVSCATQPPDECSEPAGVSSVFTCTCTAVGAYPDDLHFVWTNAEGDPTPTSIEASTNRSGAYDYTGSATFRPSDNENTVTCSLGGYSGSWSVPDSNYTLGPPGKCNISVSCNPDATVATLTCSCPNGVPDNPRYTYYNETGAVVTSEVSVTPGLQFTVSCRGCNGVNYGEDTFTSKNHTCKVSTTAKPPTTVTSEITSATPTVPTATGGPTESPKDPTTPEEVVTKSSVGLIVGCTCAGVAIIVVMGIIIVVVVKKNGGGHTKHTSDPPQNDDPVITMNASTTSSLAPLYGEVKKEKKKKSDDSVNTSGNIETPVSEEMSPPVYALPANKTRDKPDGNGAGPESDMPTYADVNKPTQPAAAPRTSQKVPDDQPMQELQYADLDHGKKPPTNEIRKPQDEPTEYATVQSVIV